MKNIKQTLSEALKNSWHDSLDSFEFINQGSCSLSLLNTTNYHNDQLVINDLNSSIKSARKTYSYLENYISLWEIENLKYKLQSYQTKLILDSYRYFEYNAYEISKDTSNLHKIKSILERIVKLIEELINDPCNKKRIELAALEKQLQTLEASPCKVLSFEISSCNLNEVVAYTEELCFQLHLLKFRLTSLLKKKILFLKRDIRQCLRDIIHFLFKNMDDSTGDNNVLVSKYRNQHLINSLIPLQNENRMDFRTIKFNINLKFFSLF